MTVRSLDLLDLPFLLRYSQDILLLDSARLLTRGNPLSATALLSYLDPRRNLYTAVARQDEKNLMGQVFLRSGETSARLVFLAPGEQMEDLALPLLDHLSKQAGEWGAHYLLAEVDEELPAFKFLRQAGFAMYAWQRIWKLPAFLEETDSSPWREVQESDWPSIQLLYAQIVPALLQGVENLPRQVSGLVCVGEEGPEAYVSLLAGPAGVWLQPLVPPDLTGFTACLPGMVKAAKSGKRQIYLCVRSYQAWLEAPLEEFGASAGPRQAVMVKRLVRTVKEEQGLPVTQPSRISVQPSRIEQAEAQK